MPKIVRFAGGKARTSIFLPALDSSAHYLGAMVPLITGADAAPQGAEFGVPAFTDDSRPMGFVVGMKRQNGSVPLWDDELKAGTVTAATGELPVKYTFSASNDESNTTSAVKEMLEIMELVPGDIVELALWGASTVSVARGTTTAAGTTGSSANVGVGLEVNATYPFALTESTAAVALANLDFITVEVDGKKPANPNHVYAMLVRGALNSVVPAA